MYRLSIQFTWDKDLNLNDKTFKCSFSNKSSAMGNIINSKHYNLTRTVRILNSIANYSVKSFYFLLIFFFYFLKKIINKPMFFYLKKDVELMITWSKFWILGKGPVVHVRWMHLNFEWFSFDNSVLATGVLLFKALLPPPMFVSNVYLHQLTNVQIFSWFLYRAYVNNLLIKFELHIFPPTFTQLWNELSFVDFVTYVW